MKLTSGAPNSMMRSSLVAALVAVLSACAAEDLPPEVCGRELQRQLPMYQAAPVDLLFVLDRSESMADEDGRLGAHLAQLVNVLTNVDGGLPDLHVGVVSSDLGGQGVPGCGAGGDGALLGGARCGLADRHLRARGLADGTVEQNVDGDLAVAMQCLVDVPRSTCPVNQPLAAAVRALDQPANAGFRRPGAVLAVVVVSDGDDCSLLDPAALAGITGASPAAIEAAVDHACFARGATCSPEDPAAIGVHQGCAARGDLGLVRPIATIDLLRADRSDEVVLMLVGGNDLAEVVSGPLLRPACSGGPATAPAPRLAGLVAAMPGRASSVSVCSQDWSDVFALLAELQRFPLAAPCLEPAIDLDPVTDGVQHECVVQLARDRDDGPAEVVAPLPACGGGLALGEPCLEPFAETASCPDRLQLQVHLGDLRLPRGTYADVSCRLACD